MKCGHSLVLLACGILVATCLSSVAFADPIKTAHGSIEGRTEVQWDSRLSRNPVRRASRW
jgi:hypothetical protein